MRKRYEQSCLKIINIGDKNMYKMLYHYPSAKFKSKVQCDILHQLKWTIPTRQNKKSGEDVEKNEPLYILGLNEDLYRHQEDGMEVPQGS